MTAAAARSLIAISRSKGLYIVTVESCTGGGVANALTSIPGASDVFWGALVPYQNGAKRQLLGLSRKMLETHGPVSSATARALVQSALRLTGKSLGRKARVIAVSTTGVAGPGGGTPRTPVGLCFVGIGLGVHVRVVRLAPVRRQLGRAAQKRRFVRAALELALKEARSI